MRSVSRILQTTVAAATVAVAFNAAVPPAALAAGHGLLDNDRAMNLYRGSLSTALRKAGHDDDWGGAARAFGVELEKGLAAPLPRPQMKWSSPTSTPGVKVVGGVVPPEDQLATTPIPVCADTAGKIIYKGHISPKGAVTEDRTPFNEPAAAGKGPCQPWLMQQGRAMQAKQANTAPKSSGQDKVSAKTARSPAFAATN